MSFGEQLTNLEGGDVLEVQIRQDQEHLDPWRIDLKYG